ncbi:MAG: energy-coupling factor ABC transporter substrate-binding protein [Propionicimonas sp.]|nr:energy-coupling factor ABC transporter substrate-binding protein [Propionicimonas sp.]
MKKSTVNILLVLALVAIFAVSFAIGSNHTDGEERFSGTDGAATSQIEASHPDYQPWFEPFFSPESGEVESGLFALQAALGGTVLGFAIGALYGRRRKPEADTAGLAATDPEPATG